MMMSREDVLQMAAEQPHGFGRRLRGRTFLNSRELTEEMRELLPASWAPLAEAEDEDSFYAALFDLWVQGCGEGALAPKRLKERLRYAGFFPMSDSTLGICYVRGSISVPGRLSHIDGFQPLQEEKTSNYPDYGPLTHFCRNIHISFDFDGSFVRHPSWQADVPGVRMPLWRDFAGDQADWREGSIFYTNVDNPEGDPEDGDIIRPDLGSTIQYGETTSYNFVEPGDSARFWSFWNNDGEMGLQNEQYYAPAINPIDANLTYILGG